MLYLPYSEKSFLIPIWIFPSRIQVHNSSFYIPGTQEAADNLLYNWLAHSWWLFTHIQAFSHLLFLSRHAIPILPAFPCKSHFLVLWLFSFFSSQPFTPDLPLSWDAVTPVTCGSISAESLPIHGRITSCIWEAICFYLFCKCWLILRLWLTLFSSEELLLNH